MAHSRILLHACLVAEICTPCTCSFANGAQPGDPEAVSTMNDSGPALRRGDASTVDDDTDEPIMSMSMTFLPDDDMQIPLQWPLGHKRRNRNQKFPLDVHSKGDDVEGRLGNSGTNLSLVLEDSWKSWICWFAMLLCAAFYCLSVHFSGHKVEDEKSSVFL